MNPERKKMLAEQARITTNIAQEMGISPLEYLDDYLVEEEGSWFLRINFLKRLLGKKERFSEKHPLLMVTFREIYQAIEVERENYDRID